MELADFLRERRTGRPFGFYVHVPFCTTRCGYCDFNTYTSDELGAGASRATYADTVAMEIRRARATLHDAAPVDTVFFGGGTPPLLGAAGLVNVLGVIREEFGLATDAEVTTEANPDSLDRSGMDLLRAGGFTRISFGVQSLAPHVLRVLDRTHTPGRALEALEEARAAGFAHVSADLIYGTPGESEADLRGSLEAVLATGIDHLSAYSLIVEPGTRLAAQVARGEVPATDDDIAAERYAVVDDCARDAGLSWYEVSNWSTVAGECRHNLGYWHGHDWWGAGPGAHSHISGLRWWNVKHPAAYADRLGTGALPVQDYEDLSANERAIERIMLAVRLSTGLAASDVPDAVGTALISEGLLAREDDRLVLTREGRLLGDLVARRILG